MKSGKVILGLLAGVAAGAFLALLVAPDKGSVIRKKITKKGEKFVDDLTDKFNDLFDMVNEKLGTAKEQAKQVKSKVEEHK